MKRLVIINILLVLVLSVIPKEQSVEVIVENVVKEQRSAQNCIEVAQITSRSMEETRIEVIQEKIIPTSISELGIELVKQFEGCKLKAYKLKGEKYYTIGYGHYGADVREGQTITRDEAERLLMADIKGYTDLVLKHCEYLDLNQNELDALVSFTYNAGLGNLQKLTANKTRTKEEIVEHITAYINSSSEKNRKGLLERRKAEKEMFLGGELNEEEC